MAFNFVEGCLQEIVAAMKPAIRENLRAEIQARLQPEIDEMLDSVTDEAMKQVGRVMAEFYQDRAKLSDNIHIVTEIRRAD